METRKTLREKEKEPIEPYHILSLVRFTVNSILSTPKYLHDH